MPREAATKIENNFVRGRISEATGLNFPENACVEEQNCVFDERGEITRRLGFDYEDQFVETSVTRGNDYVRTFHWSAVGEDGSVEFIVTQLGSTLYFNKIDPSGGLSININSNTIDLTSFRVTGNTNNINQSFCDFASGEGVLFVVHRDLEPFFIQYNSSTDDFTTTNINIKIRDLDGIDDSLDVDERPTTLTEAHRYNLLNQGWHQDVVNGSNTTINALVEWDNNRSDFPSNAESWFIYKNTSEQFLPANVDRFAIGNSPAPKGHYTFDAFNIDRNTVDSNLTTLTTVSSDKRPTCVAFFEGRVFYSGVNDKDFNTKIYFSQILTDTSKAGNCFQANDPTSEITFDLLDNDGGVINIPEVERIVSLFPLTNGIVVLATNGIWIIRGSLDSHFKATDFSRERITGNIFAKSVVSIVDVLGVPVWWNLQGIYTITTNQRDPTSLEVVSLTDETIEEFYQALPEESREFAQGAYNHEEGIIQWVYRATESSTVKERFEYDRVLNFNVRSRALYNWTISTDSSVPTVNSIISSRGIYSTAVQEEVIDSSNDDVVNSSSDTVYADVFTSTVVSSSFRYFTTLLVSGDSYKSCWAQTIRTSFKDWQEQSFGGEDYTSSFITGYSVLGQSVKEFQSNYVVVTAATDDTNNSCFMQGLWDWSTVAETTKTTTEQQVHQPSLTNRQYYARKVKVRGHGDALQLRFRSESGKPFKLSGWAVWVTANAQP